MKQGKPRTPNTQGEREGERGRERDRERERERVECERLLNKGILEAGIISLRGEMEGAF